MIRYVVSINTNIATGFTISPGKISVNARVYKVGNLPTGGNDGDLLAKASNTNYDVEWVDPATVAPVQSVNGQTGAVTLDAGDVNAYPNNNPDGYVDSGGAASAAPVQSVNGKIGVVTLNSADVGAYSSTNPSLYVNAAGASAAAPVQSVMGRTGAVSLGSSDVTGALGFTPENVSNKATDFTTADNTKYPTVLAVKNAIKANVLGVNATLITNTGNTNQNIIWYTRIPANTAQNSILHIKGRSFNASASTWTHYVYLSTANNSISGAQLLCGSNANSSTQFENTFIMTPTQIKGSLAINVFNENTFINNPNSANINWAVDQYVLFVVQNTNSAHIVTHLYGIVIQYLP